MVHSYPYTAIASSLLVKCYMVQRLWLRADEKVGWKIPFLLSFRIMYKFSTSAVSLVQIQSLLQPNYGAKILVSLRTYLLVFLCGQDKYQPYLFRPNSTLSHNYCRHLPSLIKFAQG